MGTGNSKSYKSRTKTIPGKYSSLATYAADLAISTHNCLHRYCLGFYDSRMYLQYVQSKSHVAVMDLPGELSLVSLLFLMIGC